MTQLNGNLPHMGKKLRSYLTRYNIKQSVLAARLGKTRQCVNYYCNQAKWDLETVAAVVAALRCKTDYFFTND